tara:strand:- start:5866 stop:6579 length:714 start_codon:yes stop_codon:yes gene_type:complete
VTKDDIINDLMRRRPSGPEGANITYEVRDSEYCYRARKYKKLAVPSDPSFGYDDVTLFKLGFKDRSDVREYIRSRDFDGQSDWSLARKKATLNRRANKVWERIEDAVYQVGRSGGEGIYAVSESYGRRVIANLFARSYAEAKETAGLFFGYLLRDPADIRVKFVQFGTVDDVSALNAETCKDIEHRMERCKREIEQQQKHAEQLNAMLTTLKTVESQQIAVESVATMDKLYNHEASV